MTEIVSERTEDDLYLVSYDVCSYKYVYVYDKFGIYKGLWMPDLFKVNGKRFVPARYLDDIPYFGKERMKMLTKEQMCK